MEVLRLKREFSLNLERFEKIFPPHKPKPQQDFSNLDFLFQAFLQVQGNLKPRGVKNSKCHKDFPQFWGGCELYQFSSTFFTVFFCRVCQEKTQNTTQIHTVCRCTCRPSPHSPLKSARGSNFTVYTPLYIPAGVLLSMENSAHTA